MGPRTNLWKGVDVNCTQATDVGLYFDYSTSHQQQTSSIYAQIIIDSGREMLNRGNVEHVRKKCKIYEMLYYYPTWVFAALYSTVPFDGRYRVSLSDWLALFSKPVNSTRREGGGALQEIVQYLQAEGT